MTTERGDEATIAVLVANVAEMRSAIAALDTHVRTAVLPREVFEERSRSQGERMGTLERRIEEVDRDSERRDEELRVAIKDGNAWKQRAFWLLVSSLILPILAGWGVYLLFRGHP